jgi:hypothetical protein
MFATLGALALWFGWFGFNCGSLLSVSGASGRANLGHVALATVISGAMAAVTSLCLGRFVNRHQLYYKYNVADVTNGALSGLVAVTAGCAVMPLWASVVTGFLAGLLFHASSSLIGGIHLRIDDPVDAISVHGANGLLGVLCAAFFADERLVSQVYGGLAFEGGVINGSGLRLAAALVGLLAIVGWSMAHAAMVWGLFWILDMRLSSAGYDSWFFIRGLKKSGLAFGFVEEATFETEQTNSGFMSVGFQDVLADWSPAPGESGFGISSSRTYPYPSTSGLKSTYQIRKSSPAPLISSSSSSSTPSSEESSEGTPGNTHSPLPGGYIGNTGFPVSAGAYVGPMMFAEHKSESMEELEGVFGGAEALRHAEDLIHYAEPQIGGGEHVASGVVEL